MWYMYEGWTFDVPVDDDAYGNMYGVILDLIWHGEEVKAWVDQTVSTRKLSA